MRNYYERGVKSVNDISTLRYLLHVSDFHLTEDKATKDHARAALDAVVNKLKTSEIHIDYLVHTGDIIDSSDIYYKIAKENPEFKKYIKADKDENGKRIFVFDNNSFISQATPGEKTEFDKLVKKKMETRFESAVEVMRDFISKLNVAPGNIAICCGNHDVLRPFSININDVRCKKNNDDSWKYTCPKLAEGIFTPFESFLDELNVANSRSRCGATKPVSYCMIGNLSVFILNTNWINHSKQKAGYYCVNCEHANAVLENLNSDKWQHRDTLNIVLAHKPLYEICENPRLPYKRYIETPFMSNLKKYVGGTGLYLCGDKHTRSIAHSPIHAIQHYIGGEPLRVPRKGEISEVEYNLLEVSNSRIGIERKMHLRSSKAKEWTCEMCPQDSVVDSIYRLCSIYLSKHSLDLINKNRDLKTWDDICQEFHNWTNSKKIEWKDNLNILYRSICKYRRFGIEDIALSTGEIDIYAYILNRIKEQMRDTSFRNILNIRGEYDAGKSTFLSLFYIYLLNQYSIGAIDFIPAYYSLENSEMSVHIEEHVSYNRAAKEEFKSFVREIQNISEKEHQRVCYIIDGLDEQDCWSYSSEDSIGRGILDVLAECDNSWYIMAYSQHRLPFFKNTMPMRKYNDTSDIMYFNPVDVRDLRSTDKRFENFVGSFLSLVAGSSLFGLDISNEQMIKDVCEIIRKFRRLTINPGFMYQNLQYITAFDSQTSQLLHINTPSEAVYAYYIDRQEMICMDEFGYGFVNYAPIMAYLFTFKGYTYERFINLPQEGDSKPNVYMSIIENRSKVYQTFMFIKKHSDAREYLIAMHYNRELRFYAEHPNLEIEEDSILNEFITRNVSVIIRKLWTDKNKFIIVCDKLLQRENLSNTVQSTLIYCLAHMKMYKPIRDALGERMREKAEKTLKKQYNVNEINEILWDTKREDHSVRLRSFIDLGLLHTLVVYSPENYESTFTFANALVLSSVNGDNSDQTSASKVTNDLKGFIRYNRQLQRLYYGDLYMHGEANQRLLDPCDDKVDRGFDFHNCFNYLLVKIYSDDTYPLKEFDLFTIVDLLATRSSEDYIREHCIPSIAPDNTFFIQNSVKGKAEYIIQDVRNVLESSIEKANQQRNQDQYIRFLRALIEKIPIIHGGT